MAVARSLLPNPSATQPDVKAARYLPGGCDMSASCPRAPGSCLWTVHTNRLLFTGAHRSAYDPRILSAISKKHRQVEDQAKIRLKVRTYCLRASNTWRCHKYPCLFFIMENNALYSDQVPIGLLIFLYSKQPYIPKLKATELVNTCSKAFI